MKIYYVTANLFKIKELTDYVAWKDVKSRLGVEISPVERELQDLLHPDIDVIVRHKALLAYGYIGRPCVVEHGGLLLDAWQSSDSGTPGLLGGIGHVVWKAVGDRMCGFLRAEETRRATAVSAIGYCDGRRIRVYRGETPGKLTEKADGEYQFNWDPIFVPDGFEQTYGKMGMEAKRATSPVIKAWESFVTAEFAVHQAGPRRGVASNAHS